MLTASFSIAGVVRAGDVVTVALSGAGLPAQHAVAYTVTAADAAAGNPANTVAANIAAALEADSVIGNKGGSASASGATVTITLPGVSYWDMLSVVTSVTAGPTTAATVAAVVCT